MRVNDGKSIAQVPKPLHAGSLISRLSHLVVCLLLSVPHLFGQMDSRAAEIQREREQQREEVEPQDMKKVEKAVFEIEEKRLIQRFQYGWNGLRLKVGSLPAGSGFAAGPEYHRDELFSGQMSFRTSAELSTRLYQKYALVVSLPKLLHERLFVDLRSVHRNYPQVNYYGPGAGSLKGNRTNYRLEDTAMDANLGVRPWRWLKLGGSAGYVWTNVGPGTDSRLTSSEELFTAVQAPGIDRQTNFFRYGSFAQLDYRDDPLGPKSGGNYIAQYSWYKDRGLNLYDFRRLNVNLEQYIPLFNKRRVFALRARTALTDTDAGGLVPFYMQPLLGGSEDLRGFRQFRFSDNNMLSLTAEYRWEAFSGLDMAIFYDAGKVFPKRSDLNLRNLERSYGFGLRFNVLNRTFIRTDFAWSREGFQVWFKFYDVFRQRPLGTAGSQPIVN